MDELQRLDAEFEHARREGDGRTPVYPGKQRLLDDQRLARGVAQIVDRQRMLGPFLDLVEVEDFLGPELDDEEAEPRLADDVAEPFQFARRLAHGAAADAEMLREPDLVQPFAAAQLAGGNHGDDLVPDAGGKAVGDKLGATGSVHRRSPSVRSGK